MLPVAVHKIIITQVKFSFSVRVAGMENLTLVGWLPDHVVLRLATKIWQPVRPFVRSACMAGLSIGNSSGTTCQPRNSTAVTLTVVPNFYFHFCIARTRASFGHVPSFRERRAGLPGRRRRRRRLRVRRRVHRRWRRLPVRRRVHRLPVRLAVGLLVHRRRRLPVRRRVHRLRRRRRVLLVALVLVVLVHPALRVRVHRVP